MWDGTTLAVSAVERENLALIVGGTFLEEPPEFFWVGTSSCKASTLWPRTARRADVPLHSNENLVPGNTSRRKEWQVPGQPRYQGRGGHVQRDGRVFLLRGFFFRLCVCAVDFHFFCVVIDAGRRGMCRVLLSSSW